MNMREDTPFHWANKTNLHRWTRNRILERAFARIDRRRWDREHGAQSSLPWNTRHDPHVLSTLSRLNVGEKIESLPDGRVKVSGGHADCIELILGPLDQHTT